MSIYVNVRTKKRIQSETLLKNLADKGEKIVAVCDFPVLKFGNHFEAIRGIEVIEGDEGYEVRVCAFSSKADYLLFAKTISMVMEMTGGEAYMDDSDDDQIENPLEVFNEEWAQEQLETNIYIYSSLIRFTGTPVVIEGMFCNLCIGPNLLNGFEIPLKGDCCRECREEFYDYLCYIQWHLSDKKNTSSRILLVDPESQENDKRNLSVSLISIRDGKVDEFDYISNADILAIINFDKEEKEPVLLPFGELWKILPEGVFRFIDDWQYERVGELTVEMVNEMMVKATLYQPENIYKKPVYPGHGFDESQNTFILMWNPAFSSVSLEDHNNAIENMLTEQFNWSVWEYEKAKCGDRFFLVRVGEGNTGIVMSGVFDSNPYQGSDWSGKGRKTFYMDMSPNVILNPDKCPMLTTSQLCETIPTFDWTKGHSGRILTQEEARKLESLWHKYMQDNEDNVNWESMSAIRPLGAMIE